MDGKREKRAEGAGGECMLSHQARSLWAKTDSDDESVWLPLYVHAADAAYVMARLWDEWVPSNVRSLFAGRCCDSDELARKALVFLAGVHDAGKATPVFQAKPCGRGEGGAVSSLAWKPEKAGLPIGAALSRERYPTHPIAGQALVDYYLQESFGWSHGRADAWGSIVGAHHGNVPDKERVLEAFSGRRENMGHTQGAVGEAWRGVQRELLEYARDLAGLTPVDVAALGGGAWDVPTDSVACGLLIMADWIASNQDLFPLVPLVPGEGDSLETSENVGGTSCESRGERAWRKLDLSLSWSGEKPVVSDRWFCERFGLPEGAAPRPVQRAAMEAAGRMDEPSLLVIEAPMGEGKTEAALAAAEIVGARFGCGGMCVALPTMATTDAMFGRVHRWLERLTGNDPSSVYLAHGKAQLNEEYRGIISSSRERRALSSMGVDSGDGGAADERVVVSDWMQGRKKGMLASFVVCTVDQVLMGALDMRHLSLRHLALAGKVIIIDECHAYDSYMQQYLQRALEWLGAWGCPVILLSATLPSETRDHLISAYQSGRSSQRLRPAVELDGASLLASIPRGGSSCRSRAGDERADVRATPSVPNSVDESYPLLSVASESCVRRIECPPSSRRTQVDISLMSDEVDVLVTLLEEELAEGGVAGVICDTVTRAQAAYRVIRDRFGRGGVALSHSRFVDLDRMENESRLRTLLGPGATRANGTRPERMVVVGTQVLEQSLDIDFDLLVTDVAPIDLLMQRLGRVHRHARGADERDRPSRLRSARCLVRGVEDMATEGPSFAIGVSRVYDRASLMETLAVTGLFDIGAITHLSLPQDIARLVRMAYLPKGKETIPEGWLQTYGDACGEREKAINEKKSRAEFFLLPSAQQLARDEKTLTNLFSRAVDDASDARMNEDAGQRAVRDTQETVEVLLVRREGGSIRLLPWVGDEQSGVERGQEIPTAFEPDWALAAVLAQCAVRLPLSLCRPQQLDKLVEELERGCERWVAAWQTVPVLAGRLALALEKVEGEPGVFEVSLLGQSVRYAREDGLSTACRA